MITVMRHLLVILGDQLNHDSAVFDGFDAAFDRVWMAEVREESVRIPVSRPRIVMFLAAMRHFRDELRAKGRTVDYVELAEAAPSLEAALLVAVRKLSPQRVIFVTPGEWGVRERLRVALEQVGQAFEERADRHFLCSTSRFAEHAKGRKQLRMEFFYREMRRAQGVLIDADGEPERGRWNFDVENRASFGRGGPGTLLDGAPIAFTPDALTQQVIAEVHATFAEHVGELRDFDWPVTREQSLHALQDFIAKRLESFGEYQDAMWTEEPWLFHSRLSAALNLKLLDPREVITAAEQAYRAGRVPLAAAEGFIRQILGWREYVRGIYWLHMPGYLQRNALTASEPLPSFYWTGDTDMHCLRQCIEQTLRFGYAHHIQRLMVTGLFTLLLGVDPRRVHEWYLSVYVDAVEWVELPNTLGMSQYADGGVMASKPYVATGRYIQKMSNYCDGCRYDPAVSVGDSACPFTTLYWDFLLRHQASLRANPRMGLQLRNLARLDATTRARISKQAETLRCSLRPRS
jgi:deoxyribodipyrimidine photolyase-related protein